MSVTDGIGKAVATRKPGGFLLVFLPVLILAMSAAALYLGILVAAQSAGVSGYGIDEVVTGAITPVSAAQP